MEHTRSAGRAPALAVLAIMVLSGPSLSGCTPRHGDAVVDNRTSSEVVLWDGRVPVGSADAGGKGLVSVGDPGDCIESVAVVTADGSRMAIVDGPVCDEQTFVVEETQLVPSGSVTLTNASSVSFDDGYAGAMTTGSLYADDERVLHLPMPASRCLDLTVHLWALDGDRRLTAEATVAERVCHGDRLVVVPEDVEIRTAAGWGWLVPEGRGSLGGDPDEVLPPAPDGRTATVTVTNGTDVEIVANLGLIEHAELAPGQSADLPLRLPVGECETYRVFANMPADPYQRVPPGAQLELCHGETVEFTPRGLAVIGPDGAVKVETTIDGWLVPGPGPEMARVTVTNSTDVEVRVWVGGNETAVLAPGESDEVPLRTTRGECVARRLFADVPGQEARLQTAMTEVCDGDSAVVTVDGIALG